TGGPTWSVSAKRFTGGIPGFGLKTTWRKTGPISLPARKSRPGSKESSRTSAASFAPFPCPVGTPTKRRRERGNGDQIRGHRLGLPLSLRDDLGRKAIWPRLFPRGLD